MWPHIYSSVFFFLVERYIAFSTIEGNLICPQLSISAVIPNMINRPPLIIIIFSLGKSNLNILRTYLE